MFFFIHAHALALAQTHTRAPMCMLPRPSASLISTIRFMMADTDTFVTAETGIDGSNSICYWDLARGGGAEPVHVYRVRVCIY